MMQLLTTNKSKRLTVDETITTTHTIDHTKQARAAFTEYMREWHKADPLKRRKAIEGEWVKPDTTLICIDPAREVSPTEQVKTRGGVSPQKYRELICGEWPKPPEPKRGYTTIKITDANKTSFKDFERSILTGKCLR